jgi:chemotaxis family two-component system response regulator Rcp1
MSMKTVEAKAPTIEVLLVEDSPGDVRLMHEAFRMANKRVRLNVVPDGVEAVGFLKRKGAYFNCPRPNLILMDLNLPKMGGLEVLKHIKEDTNLATIPTIILTISDAEVDIARGYRLQANCYLRKPVELEAFENLVKSINDFWLTKATLPSRVQAA